MNLNIGHKIGSMLEGALSQVAEMIFSKAGSSPSSFCQLEAPISATSYVTTFGGMMSLIEIQGIRSLPGEPETLGMFDEVRRLLHGAFSKGDHRIKFYFEYDPPAVGEDLRRMLHPSVVTARALGIEGAALTIVEDTRQVLANMTQRERCWMEVTTFPTSLDKQLLKQAIEDRLRTLVEMGMPVLSHAQDPGRALPELVRLHESLTENLSTSMARVGLGNAILTCSQIARVAREAIFRETTPENWEPAIPTVTPGAKSKFATKKGAPARLKPAYARHTVGVEGDFSHAWWPTLGEQIINRAIPTETPPLREMPGVDVIRIGKRYATSMCMDVGPQDPDDFLALFGNLCTDIPWRLCLEMRTGGLNLKGNERTFLNIMGWMGEVNRKLKATYDGLESMQNDKECIVGFRASIATWGDTPAEISRRHSEVMRGFEAWGLCSTTDNMGDEVEAYLSTVPGFSSGNPAVSFAAPLGGDDGIVARHMLPLSRPGSPFASGNLIFRTPDGRPYPYEVFSGLQNTWVNIWFGTPGMGKSQHLCRILLACTLAPGLQRLPKFVILDVGGTSQGALDLLSAELPANRKGEVASIQLRMTRDYTINPFDVVMLGCRAPDAGARDYLVNFLTTLTTQPSKPNEPVSNAGRIFGLVVDEVFKLFSDANTPRLYRRFVDEGIDQGLDVLGYQSVEGQTTWFEVTDYLFSQGKMALAYAAQRYARPLLEDLIPILMSPTVQANFGTVRLPETDQLLIDYIKMVLTSVIREFPILNGITQFTTGQARVISVDFQEVLGAKSAEGKWRTAMMYMLVYGFMTRDFSFRPGDDGQVMPEFLRVSPEIYHDWMLDFAHRNHAEYKGVVLDETHNTEGNVGLWSELERIAREGRKWNTFLGLSSQRLQDFSEALVDLTTTVFIMGSDSPNDIERARDLFKLSDVAAGRMELELKGPPKFLAIFKTKRGRYVQILESRIGAIMRWALTTDPKEKPIRQRLYELMPKNDARKLLSEVFPGQEDAKLEVSRRERQRTVGDSGDLVGVQIAEELYANWLKSKSVTLAPPK